MKLLVLYDNIENLDPDLLHLVKSFLRGFTTVCSTDYDIFKTFEDFKEVSELYLSNIDHILIVNDFGNSLDLSKINDLYTFITLNFNKESIPEIVFFSILGDKKNIAVYERSSKAIAEQFKIDFLGNIIVNSKRKRVFLNRFYDSIKNKKAFILGKHFGNTAEIHTAYIL